MDTKDPGEAGTSRGVTNNLARGVDMTDRTCLTDGCESPVGRKGAKGLCPACYRELRKATAPPCIVPDCTKPKHSANGYCGAHYARLKRYGDPEAPLLRQPNVGPCEVEGCEEPMRKVRLCANHYAMRRTHGEIREWHYRWGDGGYNPAHRSLQRVRGKAATHSCVDCGQQAQEWSYNGGDPDEITDADGRTFSRDPGFYSPRCVKCHRVFDDNPIAMRHTP